LTQCITDECVYRLKLDNGKIFIVLLYVDDLIIASNSKTAIGQLKQRIQERFKVKILGSLKCFLNIEVIRDRTQHKICLKQSQYTAGIIFDFAMSDCNPVRNPEIPKHGYIQVNHHNQI